MFEYLPGSYVWNLAVVAALNSGGPVDEVDRACRPIREAAAERSDVGTERLMVDWTAVVDHLERRAEVRAGRVGPVGRSLGGYYAPRAVAFEKRLALCRARGANHDRGAVQRRRLDREGENPVPHCRDHLLWVRGRHDVDAHVENDRQIPLAYEHRSLGQATAKRGLRILTPAEGGAEHIGLDHLPDVGGFIADWVADTFAELP